MVADSSPLIFLADAMLLDLLPRLASRIVVPSAVLREIQGHGHEDKAATSVAFLDWLETVEVPEIHPVVRARGIGLGESSVLSWAAGNPPSVALLDDLAARRLAVTLEIPVRGTLGLILTARQRGLIPAARPILERLRDAGMYLSDKVLNESLARVEE